MKEWSTFWRIVFAPLSMQSLQKSDRDYPFAPVTITRRADHDGTPAHSGRWLKQQHK
jgi:hypothetical protein